MSRAGALLLLLACSSVPVTISRPIPEQVVPGNPLSPILPDALEFPLGLSFF